MGDVEFLLTKEFAIPVGQIVAYVFVSTLSFFFKRYKFGLLISFAFVFNWGFLHASTNFVDMMGKPTLGLIIYLFSGLVMAISAVVGFFREE